MKTSTVIALLVLLLWPAAAFAHQSGCHRWHSCPSDTGSYTCGDTGYCSGCGNNYYCRNGSYSPGWQARVTPKATPKATPKVTPKVIKLSPKPTLMPKPILKVIKPSPTPKKPKR